MTLIGNTVLVTRDEPNWMTEDHETQLFQLQLPERFMEQ
jgi:hypothetical protein